MPGRQSRSHAIQSQECVKRGLEVTVLSCEDALADHEEYRVLL